MLESSAVDDKDPVAMRRNLPKEVSWLFILILALVAPRFLGDYEVSRLTIALVYFVAVCGIVVISGYGGAPLLGHGAFVGLGAYVTAILMTRLSLSPLVSLALTLPVGYIAGSVLGRIVVRMRGLYFAVATFVFALVFPHLVKRFPSVTGGVEGIMTQPLSPPTWLPISSGEFTYYASVGVASLVVVSVLYALSGPGGRRLQAMRDDSLAAETCGVSATRTTMYAFTVATTLGCIAGGLYTFAVGYVSPSSFPFDFSILLYVSAIIGGFRSIYGALIAAAFLVYVPTYVEQINPGLSPMVYGIVVVVVIIIAPNGLAGLIVGASKRVRAIVASVSSH